ncbi:MAG: hypothetical protein AAGH15_25845 [Myxococcota bacterium]
MTRAFTYAVAATLFGLGLAFLWVPHLAPASWAVVAGGSLAANLGVGLLLYGPPRPEGFPAREAGGEDR